MADLPTVTVSQDQYDLAMELFEGQYGGVGQPATVEEAYGLWVRRILRSNVQNNQFNVINQQHMNDLDIAVNQAFSDLAGVWPQE